MKQDSGLSSHLAEHALGGAQGHVQGDVGRMVKVGRRRDNLLDALGRIHFGGLSVSWTSFGLIPCLCTIGVFARVSRVGGG